MKLTDQQIEFLKELDVLLKKYRVGLEVNIWGEYDLEIHGVDWRININERKVYSSPSVIGSDIENWPEGIDL